MKKRVIAILLSGIMVLSGTATTFAADSKAFSLAESDNDPITFDISEEEPFDEVSFDVDTEELIVSEEVIEIPEESYEDDSEIEVDIDISEDPEEPEPDKDSLDDRVFPTGFNADDPIPEIIKGENYDEATFQGNYSSKYITPKLPALRNQEDVGTCWTFATMALLEINLMNSGKISAPDLSELHLAYFAYNTAVDPLGGTEGDYLVTNNSELLDRGGNFEKGFNTLQTWTGAASEATVPYSTHVKHQNPNLSPSLAYKDVAHIESSFSTVVDMAAFRSSKDISALNPIKKMITDYGAAGMSFRANDGTYGSTSGTIYSQEYKSYYNPTKKDPNHAVVIVGWDDNFPKENFINTAPGNGAFLIRNSWASTGSLTNMDYTGYFWMSYYEATISDNFYAATASASNNYDNNYQYDGYTNGYCYVVDKGANVFKAHAAGGSSGEILKAVSFYSSAAGTSYTIEVYKDVKNAPSSGTLVSAATTKGSTEFSGYYKVPLKSEVTLSAGSKFAVVVTLGTNALLCDADTEGSGYAIVSHSGESYWKNGSSWSASKGNFRIKAYTDNVGSSHEPDPDPGPAPDPDPDPEPEPEIDMDATLISLSIKEETVSDTQVQLSPVYNPARYYARSAPIWSSSDKVTAKVDSKGLMTYGDIGETTVTCTVDGVSTSKAYKRNLIGRVDESEGKVTITWQKSGRAKNYYLYRGKETDTNLGDDYIYVTANKKSNYTYIDTYFSDNPPKEDVNVKYFIVVEGDFKDKKGYRVYSCVITIKAAPDPYDPNDNTTWGDINDDFLMSYFGGSPSHIPRDTWYVVGDNIVTAYSAEHAYLSYAKCYTGSKITFDSEISVYSGKRRLTQGKDYSIAYSNNVNANYKANAMPNFTIKPKGKNTTDRTFYFNIYKAPLSHAVITSETDIPVAKGKKKLSSIKVKVNYGSKTLKAKKDYVLYYHGPEGYIGDPSKVTLNTPGATYKIIVEAADDGNYSGTVEQQVIITVVDSNNYVLASKLTVGNAKKKAIKISYCDITSDTDIASLFYHGQAFVYNKKELLTYGTDYQVEAIESDYTTVGTHWVRIIGTGKYYGSKTASFKVTPYNIKNDDGGRLSIYVANTSYTGKAVKPNVVVTFRGPDGNARELVPGVDYTISYKNNKKVGDVHSKKPPKVVIKGKGSFTGTASEVFAIYKR